MPGDGQLRTQGGPGVGQAMPYWQGRGTGVEPGEQGQVATAAGLFISTVISGQKRGNKPSQQEVSVLWSPDSG